MKVPGRVDCALSTKMRKILAPCVQHQNYGEETECSAIKEAKIALEFQTFVPENDEPLGSSALAVGSEPLYCGFIGMVLVAPFVGFDICSSCYFDCTRCVDVNEQEFQFNCTIK
jgi:hypothetical protein